MSVGSCATRRRHVRPTHWVLARGCGRLPTSITGVVRLPVWWFGALANWPPVLAVNGGVSIGSWGRRLSRAPHRAMWRWCQADTKELSAGYARAKFAVNVSHSIRPSRNCQTPGCAEARSMPEAAHVFRPRSARSAEALTARAQLENRARDGRVNRARPAPFVVATANETLADIRCDFHSGSPSHCPRIVRHLCRQEIGRLRAHKQTPAGT